MTLTRAVKNGSKYGPARKKQVRDREEGEPPFTKDMLVYTEEAIWSPEENASDF